MLCACIGASPVRRTTSPLRAAAISEREKLDASAAGPPPGRESGLVSNTTRSVSVS